MTNDENRIRRCNEIALESVSLGDLPFGSLIEHNGHIVAEAGNTGKTEVTGHAEINAIKKLLETKPDIELRECTLYTNFEPCAMCAYIIRDCGIGKVVFAVRSPHVGGYTRWSILKDYIAPPFTTNGNETAPEVVGGILEEECAKVFADLQWKMHIGA